MPDTIFIFALALVIFGPKKLPEIGRQLGKLVGEFRRASNEFKMQIEEELRNAEQSDRQRQLATEPTASLEAPVPAAVVEEREPAGALTVRPPSTGEIEPAETPFKPYSSPEILPPPDDYPLEQDGAYERAATEPETLNLQSEDERAFEEQITNHHG